MAEVDQVGFKQWIDQLEDFIRKDRQASIADFVDADLAKVYKDVLLADYDRTPLPKLDLLYSFENRALDDFLFLNYYFDHIYLLNMDKRPDRLEHMHKLLKKHGFFNWSRIEGLNGKDSPHFEEWGNYSRIKMSREERMKFQRKAIASCGSWAILKSMFRLLKDAISKKWDRILVLQDDNLFIKNFHEEFMSLSKRVPKNWKLLYLGATQHQWNNCEHNRAKRCYYAHGTADGAFAVGIDSSLFREMQLEIAKFDRPFDAGTLKVMQARYGKQCPIMKPNLMIADIRDSDLRKSRDLIKFGQKLGWDSSLYVTDWER